MTHLVHTPYDGSSKLFAIGLKPLDLADWTEVDDTFGVQMREKRRLYESIPDMVFVEEPDTRAAQQEVLGLLKAHVLSRFPEHYRRGAAGMEMAGGLELADAEEASLPPLRAASLLVQEDLILMRRSEAGWRLAAGSLCFPSSWSLREKFGRPLQDIHQPVPDFGPGTRMAALIDRMFDNLKTGQPVQRFNWSLQARPDLYYPLSDTQRSERANARPSKFADMEAVARGFIRIERQTVRRMPVSGDILFTIRIYLDPLSMLLHHPEGPALAHALAGQLTELKLAQLDYKGLTADRDRLVAFLTSS
ncbi:MAG: DUF3445 domain-containing protein [Rhizobiales bacterium]|nr:DUF3445 domain-containing protein [Hyphomicrobiales bacterium]